MYDGKCDASNKYSQCNFDGFDCCLSPTGSLSLESCGSFQSCDLTALEDTKCDSQNNKEECNFDLGACSSSTQKVECVPELESDGACDLLNNKAACNFDGGDCLATNSEGVFSNSFFLKCGL